MILFVLGSLLSLSANAKTHLDSVELSRFKKQKSWLFLDRMYFDQGIAHISFDLQLETASEVNNPIAMEFAIIPDHYWTQQLTFKCRSVIDDELSSIYLPIEVKQSKSIETLQYSFTVHQSSIYHFVLRDCQKHLINLGLGRETSLIIKLNIKNGDFQHGADEHTSAYVLPFLLMATGAMCYFASSTQQQLFSTEGSKDPARLLLLISLSMNFIALAFNYSGFFIYRYINGKHFWFSNFFYLLFHSLSESMLTSLIIFIAFGWTITFYYSQQFQLYIPLVILLGIINLILTLLGKINDGEHDKYHMYDSLPSYLLVAFRLIGLGLVVIGAGIAYWRNWKDRAIVQFTHRFLALSVMYFLWLPLIMWVSQWMPRGERRQAVFMAVELFKNGVNLALLWMIASKKSKYANAKFSNRSFIEKDSKYF